MQGLRAQLERVHRGESGAVALLCLAGLLILFMLYMVLYDAGKVVQAKIDVQVAGDTAAYSAAAVEARAMNQIAFANVGKRTVNGIYNMYYFQYPMYFLWWLGQCSKCCCGWYCGCWTECFNCIGNAISGDPFIELGDYIDFIGGSDIEDILEDLGNFQNDMADWARYWATGEAMIRGVRNNAHMVNFYPDSDSSYFRLPLALGSDTEGCLVWAPGADNPTTLVTQLEALANFQDLKQRSTSSPNIASEGPAERVRAWYAIIACLAATPSEGRPYYLTASRGIEANDDDGTDAWARSNIIFTYRHEPDNGNRLRDNYEIFGDDRYQYVDIDGSTKPRTGVWSMARSEFYFPPSSHPSTLTDGAHGMWMFHPGWIGKLRPMMLTCKSPPVEMDEVWDGAMPLGRNLAMSIFNMGGVDDFDGAGFFQDIQYMDRNVIPAMIGHPTAPTYCGSNLHVMDGMWK